MCRQGAESSAGPVLPRPSDAVHGEMARMMHCRRQEVHPMTRFGLVMIVAVLAAAPHAFAACRRFGTQLECNIGPSRVVIGTQAAEEPRPARSLPAYPFHGSGLGDNGVASRRPFEIELQNFAGDPALCRKIGNETYCC
jgi:hypothetical protein